MSSRQLWAELAFRSLFSLIFVVAGVGHLVWPSVLLLGYRARLAAMLLLATLVPITIATHVGVVGDPGPLLKNIALLGGLIHFCALGAVGPSIDERDNRQRRAFAGRAFR